jgi:nucleoside-diphosphate-sugar epimerase
MTDTVLVTGGTGFVGGWAVVELLRRGYAVRTTVRSLAKEPALRKVISEGGDRLTVVAADLISDDGWDTAVRGCDYVLHVASPLGGGATEDLIAPARDGTLRVLAAATKAGVKRVVMTSSCAAATPPPGSEGEGYDETVWTDLDVQKFDPYRKSKVISERAAWKFIENNPGRTTLTTVLPGAILGPVLSAENLGSVRIVGRLLAGMPGVPRIGFNIVDVRDLVDLHIRAMTASAAAGERFIAVGGFMWMLDVAKEIRAKLGAAATKVPTRTVPDFALRSMALVNPELRGIVPMLGRKYVHTSEKAQRVLEWSPRLAAATVVDTAQSLVDRNAVQTS